MIPSIDNIPLRKKSRSVASFLKKTYDLLNDPGNEQVVQWAPNGVGFVVLSEELFAKTVLPKYFKHSNYSSFVRQLNMYNFHKIRENSAESYFHHEHFDRDNREALAEIRRKPEKKKRKVMGDSDSEDEREHHSSDFRAQKENQTPKNVGFQQDELLLSSSKIVPCDDSLRLIRKGLQGESPSVSTTKHLFSSQFTLKYENPIEDQHCKKSQQSIWNGNEADDDRLSINDEIEDRILPFPTKELMYPSKHNLFPAGRQTENFNTFF